VALERGRIWWGGKFQREFRVCSDGDALGVCRPPTPPGKLTSEEPLPSGRAAGKTARRSPEKIAGKSCGQSCSGISRNLRLKGKSQPGGRINLLCRGRRGPPFPYAKNPTNFGKKARVFIPWKRKTKERERSPALLRGGGGTPPLDDSAVGVV